MVVQVATSLSGPWYTVFYWGDGIADMNSNVGQNGYGAPENDNEPIPFTDLYASPLNPLLLPTGISLDIDARAPTGIYPYVRIYAPY